MRSSLAVLVRQISWLCLLWTLVGAKPALAVGAEIEMAGEMELTQAVAPLLARWVKNHPGKDEFDQRDEQGWVEAVTLVNGKKLQLFERGMGDESAITHRREFLTYLSAEAQKGRAFLHHLEGGFASWSWEIVNGRVIQTAAKGLDKMPTDSPAAIHYRETRAKQAQLLAARPPPEAFREFLARQAKTLRSGLLEGMDGGMRKSTAEALHGASGRSGPFLVIASGTAFPKEVPPEGTVFVEDIETLDTWAQQEVLQTIRKNQAAVFVGTQDANAAKASGKFRSDLHSRLARDRVDVRKFHP